MLTYEKGTSNQADNESVDLKRLENVEDVETNKVIMVMQKGYKLKTKVLRPAMVKVSC